MADKATHESLICNVYTSHSTTQHSPTYNYQWIYDMHMALHACPYRNIASCDVVLLSIYDPRYNKLIRGPFRDAISTDYSLVFKTAQTDTIFTGGTILFSSN